MINAADNLPKELLGRYLVEEKIGEGGMGIICRCLDKKNNLYYAAKFLKVEHLLSQSGKQQFETEHKLLGCLDHPGIIAVPEHGVEQGIPFMIMELCTDDGGKPFTLAQLQANSPGRRLPKKLLFKMALVIIDAVAYLHDQGVIHRDLKPENILLQIDDHGEYHPKLTDFGLATLSKKHTEASNKLGIEIASQTQLAVNGKMIGTYEFMSPEQRRGDTLDARSDVFSLGLILYRLATGQDRVNKFPSEINEEIPKWFDRLVQSCIEKELEKRPKNAREMLAAFPDSEKPDIPPVKKQISIFSFLGIRKLMLIFLVSLLLPLLCGTGLLLGTSQGGKQALSLIKDKQSPPAVGILQLLAVAHRDVEIRRQAIIRIADLDNQSSQLLLNKLAQRDSKTGQQALRSLLENPNIPPSTFRLLRQALQSDIRRPIVLEKLPGKTAEESWDIIDPVLPGLTVGKRRAILSAYLNRHPGSGLLLLDILGKKQELPLLKACDDAQLQKQICTKINSAEEAFKLGKMLLGSQEQQTLAISLVTQLAPEWQHLALFDFCRERKSAASTLPFLTAQPQKFVAILATYLDSPQKKSENTESATQLLCSYPSGKLRNLALKGKFLDLAGDNAISLTSAVLAKGLNREPGIPDLLLKQLENTAVAPPALLRFCRHGDSRLLPIIDHFNNAGKQKKLWTEIVAGMKIPPDQKVQYLLPLLNQMETFDEEKTKGLFASYSHLLPCPAPLMEKIRQLAKGDSPLARQAQSCLTTIEANIGALVADLSSANTTARQRAIRLLPACSAIPEKHIPALLRLTVEARKQYPKAAKAAANSLLTYGPDAIPAFEKSLRTNAKTAVEAAYLLKRQTDQVKQQSTVLSLYEKGTELSETFATLRSYLPKVAELHRQQTSWKNALQLGTEAERFRQQAAWEEANETYEKAITAIKLAWAEIRWREWIKKVEKQGYGPNFTVAVQNYEKIRSINHPSLGTPGTLPPETRKCLDKVRQLRIALEESITALRVRPNVGGQPTDKMEIFIDGKLAENKDNSNLFPLEMGREYNLTLTLPFQNHTWFPPRKVKVFGPDRGIVNLDMELTSTPLPDLVAVETNDQSPQGINARRNGLPLEAKTRETQIRLRLIPAGEAILGSPTQVDEPKVEFSLPHPLYVGKFEILQSEWTAVMQTKPFIRPTKDGNVPAENITWEDCQHFLNRLCRIEGVPQGTYRLLDEYEWEYACRAGSMGEYNNGTENPEKTTLPLEKLGWFRGNAEGNIHPPGELEPNGWGLYDTHGNLWEWCANQDRKTEEKIIRGGAWTTNPHECRAAKRGRMAARGHRMDLGFRICRVLDFPKESQEETIIETATKVTDKLAEGNTAAVLTALPETAKAFTLPDYQIEMLPIPAGTFKMGRNANFGGRENESPVHVVQLKKPFWMARLEINRGQYAQGCQQYFQTRLYLPISGVAWKEATDYCRALTLREARENRLPEGYEYRLPTEAEWEYAATATGRDSRDFPGNDNAAKVANSGGNPLQNGGRLQANSLGLQDLCGNVGEWCQDNFSQYSPEPAQNPCTLLDKGDKVWRGGSYQLQASDCTVYRRHQCPPQKPTEDLGFRIVLAPRIGN